MVSEKRELREWFGQRYGLEALHLCSLRGDSYDGNDEDLFRRFMSIPPPIKLAVETGTYNGLSAALLTQYAEHVHTFDIHNHPQRLDCWRALGVEDHITFHLIKNDEEKAEILKTLDFDFAFIDGRHFGVDIDFKLLKCCGRILFHDYTPGYPVFNLRTYVKNFIDSLGLNVQVKSPPFAYWENLDGSNNT